MQHTDERTICHYRFSLQETMRVKGQPFIQNINIDEVLSELKSQVGQVKEYGGDTRKSAFTIKSIKESKNYWELLINVVQTGVKSPVKSKLDGTNRQVIALDAENGLEKSTHLLIKKTKKNFKLGNLSLLEKSDGLSVKKIERFLNALIKTNTNLAVREKPSPSAPKDKTALYKCSYKLNVEAVISPDLYAEIAQGAMKATTVMSHDTSSIAAYDSNTDPLIKKNLIQVEIIQSSDKNKIENYINKIRTFANKVHGYACKVEYNDASGAVHTATISSDTGNLLDGSLFVHKQKISEILTATSDSYDGINREIIDKMKELI